MRGEGVAQHMRAHPFRRDTRSSSQFLHHLVKPDAAEMTFAGGEKQRRFRCHMDRPLGNGSPRTIRNRRQSPLAALSTQEQERPVSCNGLEGHKQKRTGAETSNEKALNKVPTKKKFCRSEGRIRKRGGYVRE